MTLMAWHESTLKSARAVTAHRESRTFQAQKMMAVGSGMEGVSGAPWGAIVCPGRSCVRVETYIYCKCCYIRWSIIFVQLYVTHELNSF
jgi:hypothetical protein